MSWDEMSGAGLTPREIVERLDRHIIGQRQAKRAVAIALRNRWRRQQIEDAELREEILPKNIIMIGPTGVGKTEIARRLARLARAPFLKVEASKFTEVGYVGRDVESMVRDLLELAISMVKAEAERRVSVQVRELVDERLLELLGPRAKARAPRAPLDRSDEERKTFIVGHDGIVQREARAASERELQLRRLRQGDFDDDYVEVEVTHARHPVAEILDSPQASEKFGGVFEGFFPKNIKKKRVRVREARRVLLKEEAARLIDMDRVIQDAMHRTAQAGIIFLDEIDKIAGRESKSGPDISREGVQRDLLPIVEGSSVTTKHGVIQTDHILFIAAGAFHVSKPSDLIPELQGRFPIRVELESLTCEDFRRILTEPDNSLTRQYTALLSTEGVKVEFTDGAVERLATMAWQANERLENIGARRLHTIMERVFEELSFGAPELGAHHVVVDAEYVDARLVGILEDEDMSRYIL